MSKGYRKISVGGVNYEYKVGRAHVDIRPPGGARMTPDLRQVTGLTWDEIERGTWKRYFSVTPQQIREYIEGRQT
ncbi:hypothetical protein LCGC14_0499260 [marine sediment metagenome]|uniref:Uncharacterized protein n=1 Tax=marine sediment metagenome TaxID=412755 RepID=A0A0F9URB8_9ZZZZ